MHSLAFAFRNRSTYAYLIRDETSCVDAGSHQVNIPRWFTSSSCDQGGSEGFQELLEWIKFKRVKSEQKHCNTWRARELRNSTRPTLWGWLSIITGLTRRWSSNWKASRTRITRRISDYSFKAYIVHSIVCLATFHFAFVFLGRRISSIFVNY